MCSKCLVYLPKLAQWLHNVLAAIPNILNLEKQFRDLVYDNFSRFVEDVG